MRKGAFVADPRCRKAGALRSDGSEGALKGLRRSTHLSTASAGRPAARGSGMSTLSTLVGGFLLLLTAVSVWFHDQQPKSYLQLRWEALEGLYRSRDQPASVPLILFGRFIFCACDDARSRHNRIRSPGYGSIKLQIGKETAN